MQAALYGRRAAARPQPPFQQRPGPIDDHLGRIESVLAAQAPASGAGPIDAVERKRTRLERGNADAAIHARPLLRIELLLAVHDGHLHNAFGQLHGRFDGLREAAFDPGLQQQAVHHHFNGVVAAAVEANFLIHLAQLLVHPHAHEPLLRQLLEKFAELPFPPAHHGRQNHDALAVAVSAGAALLVLRHDGGDNLLRGLAGDRAAALVAMRLADGGIKQAEIVVDFRDRAHRRARAAAGGLLLDGDGRAQALHRVHVRPLHLVEELPGVGRKGLNVTALAFGINHVERQAGLARAAQARDHSQGVARNLHVDVLQVVLPRATNRNPVDHSP